ncbi:tyrosine-protein phosphatase [Pseudalkalibacillus decolorationis]|uniref:tyrosine-protein phosphatase n=1 Tax=Pseudalkalibacillus decolorationis TaxID=163879 RepID=UPI0021493946|nr:CpsB/CapC family capsule biosynthesis tyrosine phosphatase [Pseudalkalibacillus decolorationis]
MIDIHCHILPGIDDGAQTVEDSIEMARAAIDEGITTIIATPHHNSHYQNYGSTILDKVVQLNDVLNHQQVDLTILPGQEPRITGELLSQFETGEIHTLTGGRKYMHIELPSNHVPSYSKSIVFELQLKGITPIIVHPERNQKLIEEPDLLYELVRDGALTQVTASSIIGNFGKNIQKFSQQLIESNLTHFIASDAHNTTNRAFHLRTAFEEVERKFGISVRYNLQENAEYIVRGESVLISPPEPVKRKRFLGLF